MPSKNVQGQQKNLQNTQQYVNSYGHKFHYFLIYSKKLSYLVSELYLLPRCITPDKQSISELKNNLRNAFINAKKMNVIFFKPFSSCNA